MQQVDKVVDSEGGEIALECKLTTAHEYLQAIEDVAGEWLEMEKQHEAEEERQREEVERQ